jgi:hypothetical protein
MTAIPPTNPFHVARAYGSGVVGRVGPGAPVRPAQPAAPVEKPAQRVETVRDAQRPSSLDSIAERTKSPAMRRLLAGVVPGGIDFSGETPRPTSGAIPLYRHPADHNAAATTLSAGRMVDVEG